MAAVVPCRHERATADGDCGRRPRVSPPCRSLPFAFGVLLLAAWAAAEPVGTVTSNATAGFSYGAAVRASYLDPVVCVLRFDKEIESLNQSAWIVSPATASLTHFLRLGDSVFSFQLQSKVNTNISLYLLPGAVYDIDGATNTVITARFSVEFFAFPPSVTLRLHGFQGLRTRQADNLAYLTFNSTTRLNGRYWFDATSLSILPALKITNFQRLSDKLFRFNFQINFTNSSSTPPDLQCLDPSDALPTSDSTMFRCSRCSHTQRCTMPTSYPPSGVTNLEFPFSMVIAPNTGLGFTSAMSFDIIYDTLWASVELDAPPFAKGPFFLTVVWSEPMDDLTVVLPFMSGPAVDEEILQRNLTILSPTSFRMLVAPVDTGILIISINGTKRTVDLAGNANDFQANSQTRTGSQVVVVYSEGPPLEGSVAFVYESPAVPYEYQAVAGPLIRSPALTVSWSGFITATRYDLWVTWGNNLSTSVLYNLTVEKFRFDNFEAFLGIEYVVSVLDTG